MNPGSRGCTIFAMAQDQGSNSGINRAFIGISRRAESVDRKTLVKTFVDIGPLFTVLSSRDHQIVYGRRGTGKTHALVYLFEQESAKRSAAVYIDLRNIGSSGGIYGDTNVPISQRATRLTLDLVGAIHEELLNAVLSLDFDLSSAGPALDELAAAATEIEVQGETTVESSTTNTMMSEDASEAHINIQKAPAISLGTSSKQTETAGDAKRVVQTGNSRYRLHFGRVGNALTRVVSTLNNRTLLVILDEWSTVPLELQPYLADLVRRALFPIAGLTVKIAAIEQRTNFKIGAGTDYTGIEVGADASADVDLDDYMVFDNNEERAVQFFKELVFSHYKSEDTGTSEDSPKPEFLTADQLIGAAFTQHNAFEDFVKSAEGVPRDAFNVLSIAAQRGINEKISIPTIRVAARTWYQRDKEAAIRANADASDLLNWIIDEVIAHRKARAFLLRTNTRHPLIDALFDARLLHVVKKSISGQEEVGVRYDAYKLDYGCYVDLLATKAAPSGLFEARVSPEQAEALGATDAAQVLVPNDDYRAIRRAILDLTVFEKRFKGWEPIDPPMQLTS
jgi:hypothetical protein